MLCATSVRVRAHREPRWLFRDISVLRRARVWIPLCWASTIPTQSWNTPGIPLGVLIRAFTMADLAIRESPLQSLRETHVVRIVVSGASTLGRKFKSFISKEAPCTPLEHTAILGIPFSLWEQISFDLCSKHDLQMVIPLKIPCMEPNNLFFKTRCRIF